MSDDTEPDARNASRNAFTPEALRDVIPARLREFRDSLGLGQGDFADTCGIPRPSYKGYERGDSLPGALALAAFMQQGVSANWLLTGEGPMMARDLQRPPPPVDHQVLVGVVIGVEELLADEGLELAAEKKAELVTLLYEQCIADGEVKKATILRLVKLAA